MGGGINLLHGIEDVKIEDVEIGKKKSSGIEDVEKEDLEIEKAETPGRFLPR